MSMFDPIAEMQRLRRQMDEMRRRFAVVSGQPQFCPPLHRPAVDVYETETNIIVMVEIPGLNLDSLSINLVGGLLTVSGQKCDQLSQSGRSFSQLEIFCGPFERAVKLPKKAINADAAEANYKDGFLEIILPKVSQPTERRVSIDTR
jgi:HSP20 family protein